MINLARLNTRKARWLNLWHARAATRTRAKVTGFVSQPEPRTIGSFARGRQLVAGNYLFAGSLFHEPDKGLWDLEAPDAAYAAELHGFAWLDDLAAVGDSASRKAASALSASPGLPRRINPRFAAASNQSGSTREAVTTV